MMKILPNTWINITLEDICNSKDGLKRGPFGSAIKKEFFVPDGYKVYEQSNAIYDDVNRGKYFISESKYNELKGFSVEEGDFIVSCSGTLGKIALIPRGAKAGVINQALLRIRINSRLVNNFYFQYFFRSESFQRMIFDQSQGTAMNNLIGIKDFKLLEVPLPPLAEQQRIVNKIEELFSELDKGIETLKSAQQQLKVYRQAVLKYAFESLDSEQTIEQITDNSMIGIVRSNSELVSDKIGVPYIKMNNVDMNGKVNFNKMVFVSVNSDEQKKYSLLEGDILINTRNSFELVGKTGYVSNPPANAVFNNNLLRLRLKQGYNAKFVCLQMNSPWFRKQMVAEKKATTNVCALYQRDIFPLIIKTCDLKQQNLIVQEIESRLSVCDKIEESIEQGLQQAEALRQSILKKAFEGKLVPQDPNDEPASVLLERIKAEHVAAQPMKKTKTEII